MTGIHEVKLLDKDGELKAQYRDIEAMNMAVDEKLHDTLYHWLNGMIEGEKIVIETRLRE